MAVIAVAYALYAVNLVRWLDRPDFGWRTLYDSGPNVVAQVFHRAKLAGLQAGDRIQAINGKPYSTFDELHGGGLRHEEEGSVNTYSILRNNAPMEISITTGRLGLEGVFWRSGNFLLLGIVYVAIGTLVFLMKPQGAGSWAFLLLATCMGITMSYYGPSDLMRPLWLYDARFLLHLLMPAAMVHFALVFPKRRAIIDRVPWLLGATYLASFLLLVVVEILWTASWNVPPFVNRINKVLTFLGLLVFFVSLAWNFWRDASVSVRLQSKMIFLGMVLAIAIPMGELALRSIWHGYHFPGPDYSFSIFMSLFPMAIGYTIVKHDLFAIDAVIKRTYGYVLTTGAIAGVYGLFVFVTNLAFGGTEAARSPVFPLLFVMAVVFFFNPVRNRLQRLIDRVFYRLEYDYQETVQRIGEALRSLLSLDQIVKSIMNFAVGTLFLDSGRLLVLNRGTVAYECLAAEQEKAGVVDQASGGSVADPAPPLQLPADHPLVEKLVDRKREVTIYDIQVDPLFEGERAECEKAFQQLDATLVIPLIYEDKLTGLISLGRKKSGKFYRREDINLLKTLANQGAVAIENARLLEEVVEKERMEEELAIARDLQMSMLPAACPQIEGMEMAAASIPAREVGGDFYDFIEMGEGRVGIVVGDVTGKSVSGALVTAASRGIFRMLSEQELNVSEIMIRANRRTKKDIKSGMFVALLFAIIDPKEMRLTLCSAGQTQPVHLCAAEGGATLVETKGDTFPLGILEDVDYQETRLELARGDKVVFYTDGIVEAMNPQGELFGFDRLLNVVGGAGSMAADELRQEVIERVNAFAAGAPQHDDLTVIILDVKG
jgi:sigma-B regulation protein RsbU (phosphoserine phosphatase)